MTLFRIAWYAALIFGLTSSCATTKRVEIQTPFLTCINIIDQNGTSETISNLDRLQRFVNVDFLQPQPYQKVLRVYCRDECGNLPSIITSYHPNGIPSQYLEVLNGRANGTFLEWYEDGTQKISATIIGGAADLTTTAQETWLFDGLNQAWDENGCLQAELFYAKGELQGESTYYHKNGNVWKKVCFQRGQMEGVAKIFLENGELFQSICYSKNLKNGVSLRYWCGGNTAAEEIYSFGYLKNGSYYNNEEKKIAEIVDGKGFRAIFGKESITELQEYNNGQPDGVVQVFAKIGGIVQQYNIKNGVKHGEEIWYYDRVQPGQPPKPKILLNWYEGKIQGLCKTWYPKGNQESQKEMSNNTKNGLSTAWYEDGNLMLIEEYENDKLIKGEYYKKGSRTPVSQIIEGRGTATLFDADGSFLRKVEYQRGAPDNNSQ